MAIYLELPVYKACNELYVEFVKLRRTLPREERYTIGQAIDQALVDTLVLLQRINSTREKVPLISKARQLVAEVQIRFRALRDVRAIMLDEYVKRELKVRHYGRYVDDMFFVGETKEELKALIVPVRTFLRERLKLDLSENKTQICDVRHGVEFLGAFIKPYRTYVSSKSMRRIRKHIHSVSMRMDRARA